VNWLRRLADEVNATDEQMAADGYRVERTGPLSRSYRLSPEKLATMAAEAEQQHIRTMAANAKAHFALAFPEAAADLARREAAQAADADQADTNPQP
jgi:hypothetical protein